MRVSLFCGEWAIVGVKSKCHEKDDKNGVDGVVNHVFRVDNDRRGGGRREWKGNQRNRSTRGSEWKLSSRV
jgi:hypothetical protein